MSQMPERQTVLYITMPHYVKDSVFLQCTVLVFLLNKDNYFEHCLLLF